MKWEKEKVEVYQTILVLVVALLLAYWYWEAEVFLLVAFGLGVVSIVFFSIAKYVHVMWMGLAKVLGWINTRILLGVIFYLLLSPLAMWRKLMGKQNFPMKGDEDLDSYFQDRTSPINPSDFEKPW